MTTALSLQVVDTNKTDSRRSVSPGRRIEPVTDRHLVREARNKYLVNPSGYLLTQPDGNLKAMKSMGVGGYACAFVNLSPADSSGVVNVCTHSTPSCRAACVSCTAGKGDMPNVQLARQRRTRWYAEEPETFMGFLFQEIERFQRRMEKHGLKPAVRLNAGSDVPWEIRCPDIFSRFPDVQFYDYTKIPARLRRELPENYDLTFSRDETNDAIALEFLEQGKRVAAVFRATPKRYPMPDQWRGFHVINGDKHDLRFLEPGGVVVGLAAKGKARGPSHRQGGFVIPHPEEKNLKNSALQTHASEVY